MGTIDPALVHGWLAGRSLARGLPVPVADHGGWRVDTDGEEERRRYVFAIADNRLRDLVASIAAPRIFVKLCADAETFRSLLPARWSVLPANCMMVAGTVAPAPPPLPAGYVQAVQVDGRVARVVITAPDGSLASHGYAAETAGVFVYDRIVTEEPHRRRGLGRALMAALRDTRRDPGSQEVLTATPMGRALYESIGWRVYAPYTTAVIPDP
ncbi:GNAT family N-acetyltransferase [Sphingomonas sp. XXL09]|uniref:GNAT family N-acetyltransferase n=1 Tax=Sphingomonas sp. XXL09 TaxID=3457787 RepID=UPI00406BC8E5